MNKKVLYKTKVTIEILSDHKILEDYLTLDNIDYEITDGCWSGLIEINSDSINVPISGEKAIEELNNHGTAPDFFMMDPEGNEID